MGVKYRQVASDIADRIHRGELSNSDKLPGENELAQEFSVSRGTIRLALATLQKGGLIETWTGAGSFVTYDGERINDSFSWSNSLARNGVSAHPRILALGRVSLPLVAAELSLSSDVFLNVERLRSTQTGEAVTLERSRIPWQESFTSILIDGLTDGSLATTLKRHGCVGVSGRESVGVALLNAADAEVLGREPGSPFLEAENVAFDALGNVVEFLTSLLSPEHFRLEHVYGRSA